MFGLLKKKPKSEYAEAVRVLIEADFIATNEGHNVISNHEQSGGCSWMFSGSFVYMNGICNQLCDEIGDGTGDALAMLKGMEITTKSTAFLQAVMEDPQHKDLLSEKEVGFLLDLQTELITQPGIRFQQMLDFGKLAKPKP